MEYPAVKAPATVSTIAGDAEIDRAIATLVLAFSTDPLARWIYDGAHQYLQHIPQLFRALGTASFESRAAHRSDDGLGVAVWLPPDVHAEEAPLQAAIAQGIARRKQDDFIALLERTEHYRPREPHWYLSLIGVDGPHRNKGCGAALLAHGLRQCDSEHRAAYLWSSNRRNTTLYERHGFRTLDSIQAGSSPEIFPMVRAAR